ncbi:MAG TPA: MBL fold metallo-hydrolase [Anaerolineae bacterium]|nr:MBL fold metallo-hydrolase [Anaerolineae bacterium]HQI85621.1 MBL fold metallo-hydrolase [Anaerolineae bacterium]
MLTDLYPMVQFKKDSWEIDEFDCASMFLLIGQEKAMLIDAGMGIGDLRRAVRKITDKPLVVVITHGHLDHTGNARQFDEIWIHPNDAHQPIPGDLERRRDDAQRIALRQKGIYPYDLTVDLREPGPDEPLPVIRHLYDGQQFDLGGRVVTAYECFGHSPGEMIFLDENTRTLFCGDALNYNLFLGSISIEVAVKYLERMRDMGDRYDAIYNGHHDYRPLGAPLGDDCLPNAIDLCYQLLNGTYSPVNVPSQWGPGRPDQIMVLKGRNRLGYNPAKIHEPK